MTNTAKPRITPTTDRHGNPYYRVTYRGLEGSVSRHEERSFWWDATYWPAGSKSGTWVANNQSTQESAFERLIDRLDEIADCHAATVAVDMFESAGGRKHLEAIDAGCLTAWDSAKQQVADLDADGLRLLMWPV